MGFRLAGIRVRVDPTFLLVAVLLAWGARSGVLLAAWVVIVLASVLLHELGHAVAFRRYGQQPEILLFGMGGATSGSGEPLPPRRDVVVSLAGPLTGLVLVGLPALALARSGVDLSPAWHTVLADIVFVNVAWSVVNLLPVLPLDGGRVAAALWSIRTGTSDARAAHVLSAVVAGAAAAFALSRGYPFGALFAGFFCAYNVSQLAQARNAELRQRLAAGWQALVGGDASAAATAAEGVLGDRQSREVMEQASELLAWSRHTAGDTEGALAAIRRFPHGSAPSRFLQGSLALGTGRLEEALDHLVAGYAERTPAPAGPIVAAQAAQSGLIDQLTDRLLAPAGPGPDSAAALAVHLHVAGRFRDAVGVGRRAFDASPRDPAQVAYNVACSAARAGETGGALDWLERAAALGFTDASLVDEDADLDSVRWEERFWAFRLSLATPEAER